MIHFVSQETLAKFIEGRMNPADEDEDIPTYHELAGLIIEFTRDQEQAHRDLQMVLRKQGDLQTQYKTKMAEFKRQEECLKVRIADANESDNNPE
jgi:hypothetical protein